MSSSATGVPSPTAGAPRGTRRLRRWLLGVIVAIASLLVGSELLLRYYVGLGDPPLLMADPEIEYLFQPSQEVRRLGNRIHYNQYSMRADDFPRDKSDRNELRVMIMGDSVINGGAQTDQSQLATEIVRERLQKALNRPVVVGNISAATWGPPNMLAYVRKFGLFDADVVVLVLSSHDYADVPTLAPVVGTHPSFPARKPTFAIEELLTRFILPRIRSSFGPDPGSPSASQVNPQDVERCLNDLRTLIEAARAQGASVVVAQYLDAEETSTEAKPGHGIIQRTAQECGAEVVQLGGAFREALRSGQNPFRDLIHPNVAGQQFIADVLYVKLLELLKNRERMQHSEIGQHRPSRVF